MPIIDSMNGSADEPAIPVRRELLRALHAAGIREGDDRGRLSEQQLARFLENKTPSQRIELKTALMSARLYPRTLRTATPVRLFGK